MKIRIKSFFWVVCLFFVAFNTINAQEMTQDTTITALADSLIENTTPPALTKMVFKSNAFEEDYRVIIGFKEMFDSDHKRWAKELLAAFPVDQNGVVHLEYIIVCNQNFEKERIMTTTVDWFNYSFSSANAVKSCDFGSGVIIGEGYYSSLAQYNLVALYYAKTVKISADTDIIIKFKENRIKIEVLVRHYQIIMGDSLLQSKNALVGISDVFPCNLQSDNKIAYARAFINSYANSFDKVESYINFLNANLNIEESVEDNW